MKILIIRFSSIGDIVLTTPVFRCVKKDIANVEVHFLTKMSFKIVSENNPYIDKFFYLDKDINVLIPKLKEENYDYIIDLQHNLRSSKVKLALGKKSYSINKLNFQKELLTRLKINLMPGVHITTRSLLTVAPLGVKDDGLGLDYFIPQKDVISQDDLPTAHSAGYVGIVIGASYFTKKLPVYKLQELCALLQYPIVLLGGKEDAAAGEEISKIDPIRIYNACGKFNLNESADIIRKAKLIISHDTGLQYIACAFQKKILAIWGGTSPKLDVEPYYGSLFMQQQKKPVYENIFLDLWCQPCSKYGSDYCPLGHFNCMKKQDIPLIVEKAHEMLGIL